MNVFVVPRGFVIEKLDCIFITLHYVMYVSMAIPILVTAAVLAKFAKITYAQVILPVMFDK